MPASALPRRLGALVMFALALAMPGCGDSSTDSAPVAAVDVTAGQANLVAGLTVQMTATVRDDAGNVLAGRSVAWSSDNAWVARVDVNGMVTGVAPGTASISAASEGKTGSRQIIVLPVPVASVTIDPSPLSLVEGNWVKILVVALDAAGNPLTGRTAVLTTSNPGVAEVSGDVVTGMAPGTVTLTATVEGKTAAATVTVTPKPVATLAIEPSSFFVAAGEQRNISVVARDAAGGVIRGRAVTLASSNPAVAQLSGTVVTGGKPGTATLTATVEGQTATATVTVTPGLADSVAIDPSSFSLLHGASRTVTVVARDAAGNTLDGSEAILTSSDPGVATVSGYVVTGVSAGTATLTAIVEGKTGTATVTVTPPPVASITMHPGSLSLAVGETKAIFAIARDASGAPLLGREPALTTSNEAVARLTGGWVTGVSAGTATITATLEGKTATATVTVTAAPAP